MISDAYTAQAGKDLAAVRSSGSLGRVEPFPAAGDAEQLDILRSLVQRRAQVEDSAFGIAIPGADRGPARGEDSP